MNPISLAQSFLLDIAAGMVSGDEMRSRARLLAYELEPHRGAETSRNPEHFTGPWDDTASGAGEHHYTLLDALLEDAAEHEAAGRVVQAANARAAVENLRILPPWNKDADAAWVNAAMGALAEFAVPGLPGVFTSKPQEDSRLMLAKMVEWGHAWDCPHCDWPPSVNPKDIEHHYCGHCHHFCDTVTDG